MYLAFPQDQSTGLCTFGITALQVIAILSTDAIIFSKIVTAAIADIGALLGVAYAGALEGLAACLAGTGDQL